MKLEIYGKKKGTSGASKMLFSQDRVINPSPKRIAHSLDSIEKMVNLLRKKGVEGKIVDIDSGCRFTFSPDDFNREACGDVLIYAIVD